MEVPINSCGSIVGGNLSCIFSVDLGTYSVYCLSFYYFVKKKSDIVIKLIEGPESVPKKASGGQRTSNQYSL